MSLRNLLAGAFAALALLAAAPATAQHAKFLVSTDWLEQNLKNPKVRVVEVSVNPGLYERGHIPARPTSAGIPTWSTPSAATSRRPRSRRCWRAPASTPIPPPSCTATTTTGSRPGAPVFDIYGIQNVKLLDGGRKKWEAEGRPLANSATVHAPGNARVKDANPARARGCRTCWPWRARKARRAGRYPLGRRIQRQDLRAQRRARLAVRAGHVPGAVNVTWSKLVAEDGTFKSAEELKAIYQAAGVDGSKPVITYCRIGERSSHSWFALSKLLGYETRNYDGSWTEYGNSVGSPISNPAGTVWGKT